MSATQNQETARRGRAPWTRGEKWLAGVIVVGLAAAVGSWAWMNDLERMPVVKIPPRTLPVPDGYSYFVAAAQVAVEGPSTGRSPLSSPATPPEQWLTMPLPASQIAAARPAAAQNGAALSLLRQGLGLPCMAPDRRSPAPATPLASLRHLARAMRDTADVQAAGGRYADAASTALDGLAMGEKMTKGGNEIDLLVGVACQAIDRRALWRMASRLDSRTARGAARRLAATDAQATPISEVLTEEKWDTEANLMRTFEKPNWRAVLLADTGMNGQVDAAQARALSFISKRGLLGAYETQTNQMIADVQGPFRANAVPPHSGIRYVDEELSMANLSIWFRYCQKSADTRLLAAALALRAYDLDHGGYPASLTALVPKYLPAVPQDPFGSGPLAYKTARGGYLLYSIGPDGKDDGGKPIDARTGNGSPYFVLLHSRGDIVAGLNE